MRLQEVSSLQIDKVIYEALQQTDEDYIALKWPANFDIEETEDGFEITSEMQWKGVGEDEALDIAKTRADFSVYGRDEVNKEYIEERLREAGVLDQ